MSETYRPVNPETKSEDNREPGIVIIPGSNYAKEMESHEQFPSKYGGAPGNPYVYREFPKMLYRAMEWQGRSVCMASPPDPLEYQDPREYERHEELARRFTDNCQKIVNNEREQSRAMEDGWREHPLEAVEYLKARQRNEADVAAMRNYEDRNMSERAKAEAATAFEEAGRHLPEVPEKPIRRRGRPKKQG